MAHALLGLLLCATASGEVITNGLAISEAQKAMEAAHYNQTGLDMATEKPSDDLQFWEVDQGVLIFRFSKPTGRVLGIRYYLCDERPKALRKTFQFQVHSFDPQTGAMTIKTTVANQHLQPTPR